MAELQLQSATYVAPKKNRTSVNTASQAATPLPVTADGEIEDDEVPNVSVERLPERQAMSTHLQPLPVVAPSPPPPPQQQRQETRQVTVAPSVLEVEKAPGPSTSSLLQEDVTLNPCGTLMVGKFSLNGAIGLRLKHQRVTGMDSIRVGQNLASDSRTSAHASATLNNRERRKEMTGDIDYQDVARYISGVSKLLVPTSLSNLYSDAGHRQGSDQTTNAFHRYLEYSIFELSEEDERIRKHGGDDNKGGQGSDGDDGDDLTECLECDLWKMLCEHYAPRTALGSIHSLVVGKPVYGSSVIIDRIKHFTIYRGLLTSISVPSHSRRGLSDEQRKAEVRRQLFIKFTKRRTRWWVKFQALASSMMFQDPLGKFTINSFLIPRRITLYSLFEETGPQRVVVAANKHDRQNKNRKQRTEPAGPIENSVFDMNIHDFILLFDFPSLTDTVNVLKAVANAKMFGRPLITEEADSDDASTQLKDESDSDKEEQDNGVINDGDEDDSDDSDYSDDGSDSETTTLKKKNKDKNSVYREMPTLQWDMRVEVCCAEVLDINIVNHAMQRWLTVLNYTPELHFKFGARFPISELINPPYRMTWKVLHNPTLEERVTARYRNLYGKPPSLPSHGFHFSTWKHLDVRTWSGFFSPLDMKAFEFSFTEELKRHRDTFTREVFCIWASKGGWTYQDLTDYLDFTPRVIRKLKLTVDDLKKVLKLDLVTGSQVVAKGKNSSSSSSSNKKTPKV